MVQDFLQQQYNPNAAARRRDLQCSKTPVGDLLESMYVGLGYRVYGLGFGVWGLGSELMVYRRVVYGNVYP